jgi:hypothetical protein
MISIDPTQDTSPNDEHKDYFNPFCAIGKCQESFANRAWYYSFSIFSRNQSNQVINSNQEIKQNNPQIWGQWREWDLNPRPRAYESPALPLSYLAVCRAAKY